MGDVFHVKIERLETPFGDMQLSLGGKVCCHRCSARAEEHV